MNEEMPENNIILDFWQTTLCIGTPCECFLLLYFFMCYLLDFFPVMQFSCVFCFFFHQNILKRKIVTVTFFFFTAVQDS